MSFILIALAAVGAGVIQSVTGFGAPVILMLVIPYFFDMIAAPAVSSSIAMGASIALAWKFRKDIEWNICLFPSAVYLVFSMVAIRFAQNMDLNLLALLFGGFLVFLAAFFFFFSDRVPLRANWLTASICAAISGTTVGLFSIGGPLMSIYFVSASGKKESYLGNIQFMFAISNVVNLAMRIVNGIYTVNLLPYTLIGFVAIMLGKRIGLKILDRIDPDRLKKLIYAFVGIYGAFSVIQNL